MTDERMPIEVMEAALSAFRDAEDGFGSAAGFAAAVESAYWYGRRQAVTNRDATLRAVGDRLAPEGP